MQTFLPMSKQTWCICPS